MGGRETQSCQRCNYLGVPVEHTSDRDDPESWDDAISRFYEKYGDDAEIPLDVAELDASDLPDDFSGEPEELADLESETVQFDEEDAPDDEPVGDAESEADEQEPLEEDEVEDEADEADPEEPEASGDGADASEAECPEEPDEGEESETDSSVTAETDGGKTTESGS